MQKKMSSEDQASWQVPENAGNTFAAFLKGVGVAGSQGRRESRNGLSTPRAFSVSKQQTPRASAVEMSETSTWDACKQQTWSSKIVRAVNRRLLSKTFNWPLQRPVHRYFPSKSASLTKRENDEDERQSRATQNPPLKAGEGTSWERLWGRQKQRHLACFPFRIILRGVSDPVSKNGMNHH